MSNVEHVYDLYTMNTYKRLDIIISSGEGTWLKDIKGNRYLDFVSGIAVNCLGHNHPDIVNVVSEQAKKMLHVSNLYWTKEQGELAKKLIELSDHKSIFFCNSGTEAVEGAIKVAKKYGLSKHANKKKVLCFKNSFHGRTLGALSVTGQTKYQASFGVDLQDVVYCDFNDLDSVKQKMSDDICGVIVEPLQGEGGIIPGKETFLKGLKVLCETHDALLIFDEVQCGIGRLGTFYAYKKFSVLPDVVCMAKGLGGGIPIGAFIVNEKADVLSPGDHGSTFGGNPLSCAVANKVVEIISNREFLKALENKSSYLNDKLLSLQEMSEEVLTIRGFGLMLGIELSIPAKEVILQGTKNNLFVISAGDNIIRVIPPLNVSFYEIDLFLERLHKSIEACKMSIA